MISNPYIPNILGTCDHFSLPCKDPEFSVSFYEAVFGAQIYEDEHGPYIFGASPEDRALNRPIHIFLQMACGQRIELLSLDTKGVQPAGTHHGFKIGPNDLEAVMQHLRDLGVPFWGPGKHRGTNAVSIYFKDPDNNQHEFVCWAGYRDLDKVPLSQHMAKPPENYRWDPVAKRGIDLSAKS